MQQRVLITGSSRGIGRSIALALAKQGFAITLHGRSDSEQLRAVEQEVNALEGAAARCLPFDVVNRQAAKELLEADVEEHGAFYGVVLAAGVHRDAPFPAMEPDAWDEVLAVDLDGFYNVLRPLVMPMVQLRSGGRIVPIASLSGIIGNRGQVNYSAAKGGLIAASKALARELAKRKICVNCVAPGAVETDMIDETLRTQMLAQIPMKRLGRPEEISGAVRYLFSPEAEYMTGQCLVLSGGLF